MTCRRLATKPMDVTLKDKIAVVIPTVGRSSLREAIRSVRAQTLPADQVELIAVFDTPEPPSHPNSALADTTLWTGGNQGGGSARQLGVDSSTAGWIAFLDDDDSWHPDKLRRQLAATRARSEKSILVGCRLHEGTDPTNSKTVTPARTCRPDESISNYLFVGRGPTVGRNGIPSSTLFVDSQTARHLVRWDADLRRHQDWDWLIRFDQIDSRRFIHLPDVLVQKTMGSAASISAKADWQGSLDWYQASSPAWSSRARADFLAAQVMRYALQARSLSGVRACISRISANKCVPGLSSWALGLVGLIPRRAAQAAFGIAAGRRRETPEGKVV